MNFIFHEKQEGSLCAQHCLNALLQGRYFDAVDLATHAQQLDEVERQRMAEGGEHTVEYQRFIQQPSSNMDDSGFFSIQVIASALKVWNLDLIPYNSRNTQALMAQQGVQSEKAFICNYREHWIAIRKLGHQWFNLNSLLPRPELISDTYLSLFLAQLQQEGYSIFIVRGIFPDCDGDQILLVTPVVPTAETQNLTRGGGSGSSLDADDDIQIQEALRISKEEELQDLEDSELQAAIRISMSESKVSSGSTDDRSGQAVGSCSGPTDIEDLRQKRLAYLTKTSGGKNGEVPSQEDEMTDEEKLEAALKLSLDTA